MNMLTNTSRNTYVSAILGAAALLTACNVIWRYADGNPLALAFERAAFGLIFVTPLLIRAFRDGRARAALRDPVAIVAIIFSGITLFTTTTMFRWLTGPQAALVIATTPALLLIPAHFLSKARPGKAIVWVVISVLAAAFAATSGGLGHLSTSAIIAACAFWCAEMTALLSAERARARHQATVLISLGIAAGTIGGGIVLAVAWPDHAFYLSGTLAAVAVATLGTIGRTLRQFALPHLGSVVTSTSSQLIAVGTAIGGVALLNDHLSVRSAILSIIAATAAVIATVLAANRARRTEIVSDERKP